MSGIAFFRTQNRAEVVRFYAETVGAEVWLEQPDCTILDSDGFRFGFCQRETTDDCGILTFVYETEAEVDAVREAVGDAAREEPHRNDRYGIYQFFADDPDGRTAEFQTFLHEV